MRNNAKGNTEYSYLIAESISKLRLTVDYPTDYALLSLLASVVQKSSLTLNDVLKVLEANGWMQSINEDNVQFSAGMTAADAKELIKPYLKKMNIDHLFE